MGTPRTVPCWCALVERIKYLTFPKEAPRPARCLRDPGGVSSFRGLCPDGQPPESSMLVCSAGTNKVPNFPQESPRPARCLSEPGGVSRLRVLCPDGQPPDSSMLVCSSGMNKATNFLQGSPRPARCFCEPGGTFCLWRACSIPGTSSIDMEYSGERRQRHGHGKL